MPPELSSPTLYLAPLKGLTDAIFRDTLNTHFQGYDLAIAPFVNPQKNSDFPDQMLRDILPENNPTLPLIPQLLQTDGPSFVRLANRFAELGYREANWNLGCPVPMVARKKRGSGLLPYPDRIIELLEEVLPQLEIRLSIKTRLGYNSPGEILDLLPRLQSFPLTEIIIHPRIGRQLYRGKADPNGFARCIECTSHQLVYNGDITSSDVFHQLSERFPEVDRWMVGRGAIANPFLAEEIRGSGEPSPDTRRKRLIDFHQELFSRYRQRLDGPGHLLARMKPIWMHLIRSFPGQEKRLKKILRTSSVDSYRKIVDQIFESPTEP